MRGANQLQDDMFCYEPLEQRIPKEHPLRPMRRMVDEAQTEVSPQFERLYSSTSRPSIPPEKLLPALRLQVLYTVRGDRLVMVQFEYNLLFQRFVGLSQKEPVWGSTQSSKSRARLLSSEIDRGFFERVIEKSLGKQLLSDEHLTVDGTLVEAWAGHKSFKPKANGPSRPPDDPANPDVDFSGQKRSNRTHASTTDPDARLYRKSCRTESKLCYAGHELMDYRDGLAIDTRLSKTTRRSEPGAALEVAYGTVSTGRVTLGADKVCDVPSFVAALREMYLVQRMAGKNASYSKIKMSTTDQVGY